MQAPIRCTVAVWASYICSSYGFSALTEEEIALTSDPEGITTIDRHPHFDARRIGERGEHLLPFT